MRESSADMSVAVPGRSQGTPGRWTSISSPSARRKTVPRACSPITSSSAATPVPRNPWALPAGAMAISPGRQILDSPSTSIATVLGER